MVFKWLKKKTTKALGEIGDEPQEDDESENLLGNPSLDVYQYLGLEDPEEWGERINILVEIVSAYHLPKGKAYVTVELGKKVIHKTEKIKSSETVHPIWTLETGSLFLLKNIPEEPFRDSKGLHLAVREGRKKLIGFVYLDAESLLNGTGERSVFDITTRLHETEGKEEEESKAKLVLRFKRASDEDVDFMDFYNDHKKSTGIYKDQSFLRFQRVSTSMLKRSTKKDSDGVKHYRVQPGPDPDREQEETEFMTEQQINETAMEQSRKWIEAGSGSIGKLYFELIGCDHLRAKDKTSDSDAFGCLIFEDAIVQTDVINDIRSPRWMPWSQRAFVFNVMHPTSQLIIGIFDFDKERDPFQKLASNVHDPIGRVLVNLSHFKSQTVYTLQYELYHEELGFDRKSKGTVTFRMRIEWNDRSALLAAARGPPPPLYVSLSDNNDFHVGHFTAQGISGDHAFSLDTINWYIQELKSYTGLVEYIIEAIKTIVLWRGHYDLSLRYCSVTLPLHSIVAFLWGIFVVENFNLLPAFFVFSLGWLLLATMEYNQKHPSPWHTCKSFRELFFILLFNWAGPATIAENENIEAILAYGEELEEDKKQQEQFLENQKKMEEEMNQALSGVKEDAAAAQEDDGMASQVDTNSLIAKMNVLKPFLYPVQKILSSIVVALRILKSIVRWDECYYAFWIVTICFILSAILIWIPWSFIIRWSLRIIVWVFLGPWMKLIDWYYYERVLTNKTVEDKWKEKEQQLRDKFAKLAEINKIKKENKIKIQVFSRVLFGKYMISVPQFMQECFLDYPLSSSFAEPYDEDSMDPISTPVRKVMGQHLVGDMIPKRDSCLVSDSFLKKEEEEEVENNEQPNGAGGEEAPLISSSEKETEYGGTQ